MLLTFLVTITSSEIHREAKMPFIEYCRYFEYPVEQHPIITEDGYILTFFRLQKKGGPISAGKKPVLLFHGLLDSSDTWIINSEEKAPAFMLANLGYDVWLGNARGNKHSRNHTQLNPDKNAEFWAFSFQDISRYDLPAGMAYIGKFTGQKVHYVGHSQGTVIMHIALAEQNGPVLEHLDQYFGFGPVAWVNNSQSPLLNALAHSAFERILVDLHVHEFMSSPGWIETDAGVAFCGLFGYVCGDLMRYVMDADPSLDNYERYDVLVGHDPSGTSTQNMIHWRQMLLSGDFKMYDFGEKENLKKYGQKTPPFWNLSAIRRPINLFAGSSDELADPRDVARLWSALPTSVRKFFKTYDAGHCTFIWGKKVYPWMDDLTSMMATPSL